MTAFNSFHFIYRRGNRVMSMSIFNTTTIHIFQSFKCINMNVRARGETVYFISLHLWRVIKPTIIIRTSSISLFTYFHAVN